MLLMSAFVLLLKKKGNFVVAIVENSHIIKIKEETKCLEEENVIV